MTSPFDGCFILDDLTKGMVINMICKNCGTELRSDAAFCTNCGTRAEKDFAVVEPTRPDPPATEFISAGTQPPCVSSIPPPPQMPDLPVPPVMPTQFPSAPVNTPVQPQAEQFQDIYNTPPPGAPTPSGQTPFTYAPPPAPGTQISQEPQQPYSYQQQQYHQPPLPYAPMPAAQKKSNTGLIIGLTVGGVALIVLAVIVGIAIGGFFGESFNDPWDNPDFWETFTPESDSPAVEIPNVILPAPDPQPDVTPLPQEAINTQLFGDWTRDYGDFIWYFGIAEVITFTDNGDGTLGVSEDDFYETGTWFIDNNGDLIVEGDVSGTQKFSFSISGNRLTLIDSDGDTAHYIKVG